MLKKMTKKIIKEIAEECMQEVSATASEGALALDVQVSIVTKTKRESSLSGVESRY